MFWGMDCEKEKGGFTEAGWDWLAWVLRTWG